MSADKGVILIVDDVPTNLSVLMQFLESTGYKVLVATDGESAVEQAEYAPPDIILLDVMMPGINGFETCRQLKENDVTCDIPVIFMTALTDTVDKVRGFELGAADYITKPLQQEEVVARVNAHLTLHRQKREIERLRKQDQLRYEKLSRIKDEILSTASHDLKNPLAVIMTSVELLRHYITTADVRVYENLDRIQGEPVFMRDLIVNLLDLAQLEAGVGVRKKPVSLKQLLETSMRHTAPAAAEKGVALQLLLSADDIAVHCDPLLIFQALQNLISNAVKYTLPGGAVKVQADITETHVYLQVADTGIGIPEQDIPRVFERFYRVNTLEHRVVPGTGLGLSIVQEIIRQHGGNIQVKSMVGVGSTFSLSLPL